MPRPFRALTAGVALFLVTLAPATAATAATAAPPPLPDSMAAIGDSITQAVDVCCFYGNWPGHSWATGNVPLDGIASHYERIRAENPAIRGHRWNNASSGARMADAPAQARRTVEQGAEYVTILMGANDLCGWDGALTPTDTFRAQFRETLEVLRTGLPGSHVFVASIPNLYQLWSILRTHPLAQVVWQTADSCPSMLDFLQLARRPPGRHRPPARAQRRPPRRLRHLVALPLRQRPDLRLRLHPRPGLRLDFFHPSLRGQAALAALTWEASWWG
jgi:lysophospholipase L1-like esterase